MQGSVVQSTIFTMMPHWRCAVKLLLLAFCEVRCAVTYNLYSDTFLTCPRGQTYNTQSMGTVPGRSPVECAAICSRTTGCAAVNACPSNAAGMEVSCTLLAEGNSAGCGGLSAAMNSECFYMQKPVIVCENGGTPKGDHCACPLPYAGRTCERYMRDCSEGFANGYNNTFDGTYIIQPFTSPASFSVLCQFDWGGATTILKRETMDFNRNWAEVKAGFGDDLAVDPAASNYFIGMIKLRQLLSQAAYLLNMHMHYNNWANRGSHYFGNFTIGDEASAFQISYGYNFTQSPETADNGISAAGPVIFHTLDLDLNGCARLRGGAGWYGVDCSGYGVFSSDFTWPVNGSEQKLNDFRFVLTRGSEYYAS